jgi:hypothetical protein
LLGQACSRSAGPSSGAWWEGGRCQRSTFPPPVSWLLHNESNSRLRYPSSVTSARRALPHLAVRRSVLAPTGGKQLLHELLLPDASARKQIPRRHAPQTSTCAASPQPNWSVRRPLAGGMHCRCGCVRLASLACWVRLAPGARGPALGHGGKVGGASVAPSPLLSLGCCTTRVTVVCATHPR